MDFHLHYFVGLNYFVEICALFGLVVGSFLNVVIHRLPLMMEREWQEEAQGQARQDGNTYNLLNPRSCCPACGHQLTAWENIPLFSYIYLGGKCSACKVPISLRYPIVEALTAVLAAEIAFRFGFGLPAFAAFFLIAGLIALTFIDLDTQLLPDSITLPLLWAGLLVNTVNGVTDLKSAVIGAVASYFIPYIVAKMFSLITGREGMGYGDFKLMAVIGAWFGWQALPAMLVISGVSASVVGLVMILFGNLFGKKDMLSKIPFGPYLALSALCLLFLRQQLTMFYL
jgi:leader peptidase (prepilin peptidase) / N-methyltransferase